MTVREIDIVKALDEMLLNEAGSPFQKLGVILAKQVHRELIASEIKKDGGLDAYVSASNSSDGIGRGVACSLTAKIGKIKDDCKSIKKNFPDVSVLFFATPREVTNVTKTKWANEIRKEFGVELTVISRAEVVAALTLPDNVSLCQRFNIPVEVEPQVSETVAKIREISLQAAAQGLNRPPLAGRPLIDIRMTVEGDTADGARSLDHSEILAALRTGGRMVLEAPAGRGKSTTLFQLASEIGKEDGIALLVDLASWVKSGRRLLDYIAQSPAFLAQGINAVALAKASQAAPFSFLLNGWNEISGSYSDQAITAIRELEQDFPATGILVATRTHHVTPPLLAATRIKLLPLTREQRQVYIKAALKDRSDGLLERLATDLVLNDLTRTPLFLAHVVDLFAAGIPIPPTKIGILDAVLSMAEGRPDHEGALKLPPLKGLARTYLTGLAVGMTHASEVIIPEDKARPLVKEVGDKLVASGQLRDAPEPDAVLSELCAHHVLERDMASASFRFQHQQFQEFFAAKHLESVLTPLKMDSPTEIKEFTARYLNHPSWSEPLRMIASNICARLVGSKSDPVPLSEGKLLVEMTLRIDPVFSAELVNLCGPDVWKEVKGPVSDRLRNWYGLGGHHRECALAGMMASGALDFQDVILPLLSGDNDQVRMSAYRLYDDFHFSLLGPNWLDHVRSWSDGARTTFVANVLRSRPSPEVVDGIVLKDPSVKVRAIGIETVCWAGSPLEIESLLKAADQEAFERALPRLNPLLIPESCRSRALAAYRKTYSGSGRPEQRIQALLSAERLGEVDTVQLLQAELDKFPAKSMKDAGEFLIRPALEFIKRTKPEWVSQWVATRIVDGSLWSDHWGDLVTSIPNDVRDGLLARLSNEAFPINGARGLIAVLAANADAKLAEELFLKLRDIRRTMPPGQADVKEREIAQQLEDLFRKLPEDVAVSGLTAIMTGPFDESNFCLVLDLFNTVGRQDRDLREQVEAPRRQDLRLYLKRGLAFVLGQDDFTGRLKAEFATALSEAGEPEDMPTLKQLIEKDIERVRIGRRARADREHSKRSDGAVNHQALWHVRAVVRLDSAGADSVLLPLLNEPEYESDAAKGLLGLVSGEKITLFSSRRDQSEIWKARERPPQVGPEEDRRRAYAAAMRERVNALLDEAAKGDVHAAHRSRDLAEILAAVDPLGSQDLVLKALQLPDEYGDWHRIEALEKLLFGGAVVPAQSVIALIDRALGRVLKHGHHSDDDLNIMQHYLRLLPFVEPPQRGLEKIREILSKIRMPSYNLREIIAAAGLSRCAEALTVLREMAGPSGEHIKDIGESWFKAVAEVDTPEARRLLMAFVDPAVAEFPSEPDVDGTNTLAVCLAELAHRDPIVRNRLVELCGTPLTPKKRTLLADVIFRQATPESLIASLNLIDDAASPPIPFGLKRRIEAEFRTHRPMEQPGTYVIEPRASNSVRATLFKMAYSDDRRRKTALALLGEIEKWRIEIGRPVGEPRHPDFESGLKWPPT